MLQNIRFSVLTTVTYFIVAAFAVSFHEPWRDEMQAWLLARDSNSLSELFFNMRYEGHPFLWHGCLWCLSRFSSSAVLMQVFHLLIATATVYVFVRHSPFSRLQAVCFCFGYFSLFEYSVIARNYALAVFFVTASCALFQRRITSFVWFSCLLALLCQTCVHGAILALVTFGTLLVEIYLRLPSNSMVSPVKLMAGSLIFAAGFFWAVYQMVPPADSGYMTEWSTNLDGTRLSSSVSAVTRAYLPIPRLSVQFWNTHILDGSTTGTSLQFLIAVLLCASSAAAIHRYPFAVCVYVFGTAGLVLFSYLKFSGGARHDGFLFIVWIQSIWIARLLADEPESPVFSNTLAAWVPRRKHINAAVTLLLLAHVAGGLISIQKDFRYEFSAGLWIHNQVAESLTSDETAVIFEPDYIAASVLGHIADADAFFLSGNRRGTFVTWDQERLLTSPAVDQELLRRTAAYAPRTLLVTNRTIDRAYPEHIMVKQVFVSPQTIVEDERLYGYEIAAKGTDGWRYGWGEITEDRSQMKGFNPFRVFEGQFWCDSPAAGSRESSECRLSRTGGYPGGSLKHCCVRRWIADRDCSVRITSTVQHLKEMGDGINCSIVSKCRQLGAIHVRGQALELSTDLFAVAKGESIDFATDCNENPANDDFNWRISIEQWVDGVLVATDHSWRNSLMGLSETSREGWHYGWGELSADLKEVLYFESFPRFDGGSWTGRGGFPDARLGHCMLNVEGGHPGAGLQKCCIRRWVTSRDCRVKIESQLTLLQSEGDGIWGIVIPPRGNAVTHHVTDKSADLTSPSFELRAGEHIDFVVYSGDNELFDQFTWRIQIDELDSSDEQTWNSLLDFSNTR